MLLMVTMSLVAACANKPKTVEAAQTTETTTAETTDDGLAPDFELPDLQGNPLKLSSLRGKYVVLDFWGSWCVWCIRGIPAMKEAYTKHKDKMEILGIVRCSDDFLPTLGQLYQIEGFPTKVVIDPEGKIAKVVVGEDPEFYTYLDELFK